MNQLEKLIQQYEALGEEIDKLEARKDWPDSLDGAREVHPYWGFEISSKRYIICPSGSARGLAVSASGTWTDAEDMQQYWRGRTGRKDYRLVGFDTKSGLYQWMMDGQR